MQAPDHHRHSPEEKKHRDEDKRYIYVIVRSDLSVPQQLVQACHASCMAGEAFGNSQSSMVLLSVDSEKELKEIGDELDVRDIAFKMFFEPDWNTGHSALATEALKGKLRWKMRDILKKRGIGLWSVPDVKKEEHSAEVTEMGRETERRSKMG